MNYTAIPATEIKESDVIANMGNVLSTKVGSALVVILYQDNEGARRLAYYFHHENVVVQADEL